MFATKNKTQPSNWLAHVIELPLTTGIPYTKIPCKYNDSTTVSAIIKLHLVAVKRVIAIKGIVCY